MARNGDLITLTGHDYAATIATSGATLVALEHRGRPLVVPFDADAGVGVGYQGRTLVPWPNRLADGAYDWAGERLEVPVNEPDHANALHGLGCWVAWTPTERSDAAVTLELDLPAQPGYPFDVVCATRYELTPDGLVVTITGRNDGPADAPFGASSHPYLTCLGAGVDATTLTCPADQILLVDARLRPQRLVGGEETDWDFRAPTPLAGRSVDHAYTGLPPGGWQVTLADAAGHGVRLTSDAPWVQLYSGEALGRAGVAVEPMTCPPDAFNNPDADVALAPGASRTLRFTIGVLGR